MCQGWSWSSRHFTKGARPSHIRLYSVKALALNLWHLARSGKAHILIISTSLPELDHQASPTVTSSLQPLSDNILEESQLLTMSNNEGAEEETANQRAARLRREKRQAKATSEDRLGKIKQLNGGVAPPSEVLGGPTAVPTTTPQPVSVDDPAEVDISSQSYGGQAINPSNGSTISQQDPMLQAMLHMQAAQSRQNRTNAGPAPAQAGEAGQDDMTKMLQQLMGGDPNDPNSIHQTQDPMQMMSALLGGKNGQSQPIDPQAQKAAVRSAQLWRITHAIFAFTIAGYIILTTTFDGTLLSRTQSIIARDTGLGGDPARLFWIFVTAELGLQTVKFFVDGGRLQGTGILATISNMAPEPYAGYVRTFGRWLSILGSIVSDAMVVVFVLGVTAWWRGASPRVKID
ncbi:hypothetical protein MRB53_039506 [Persea americana]|nr:hypothetical protein MRB53_039506 [Persea americana]